VLTVGDALITDMLGAAAQGFDAVFVQGGIHAGEPFPCRLRVTIWPWRLVTVALVDSLR
jgi:ribonucleotide monophosphatase NagD (HAD superfamily)